ncbi:MAG: helix-turn-helix domain-containing protein [Candidatus Acetothermia bacterium]
MGEVEAFLKPVDVARYTGLSLEGVQDLIEEGQLETETIDGATRIRKTEVDRWLDEQVSLEKLMNLISKLEEEPDPEEVASLLDMEVEDVRPYFES